MHLELRQRPQQGLFKQIETRDNESVALHYPYTKEGAFTSEVHCSYTV